MNEFDIFKTQMINYQTRDEDKVFVDKVSGAMDTILDRIRSLDLSGGGLFRDPTIKKQISIIDESIKIRFHIPVHHIHSPGIGYACMPVPPMNESAINKNAFTNGLTGMTFAMDDEVVGETDTNVNGNDYITIMSRYGNDYKNLAKVMNSDGIVIDRENATIDGLPDKYKINLLADFKFFADKLNYNGRHMTSILLHEMGHVFTHIEYSYRSIYMVGALLDALREGEGKSSEQRLKLINENVLDEEYEHELDAKGNLVLTVNRTIDRLTDTPIQNTDSESYADSFAVRFGLGNELSESLVDLFHIGLFTAVTTSIFVGFLYGLAAFMILYTFWPMFITMGIITITTFLDMYFNIRLSGLILGSDKAQLHTYRDNKKRIKKIYLDMVRQIRVGEYPKRDKKVILKMIDMVGERLENVTDNEGILEKIGNKMPWNREAVKSSEMMILIEELIDNQLHITGHKMKGL